MAIISAETVSIVLCQCSIMDMPVLPVPLLVLSPSVVPNRSDFRLTTFNYVATGLGTGQSSVQGYVPLYHEVHLGEDTVVMHQSFESLAP